MTSTLRIPPTEITGLKGAIVKRFARKMLGEVPESLGVMWHNQKVLNFGFGLGRKTQKWDACPQQLKAFAHMAVASYVGLRVLPGPRVLRGPQQGARPGQGA